MPGSGNTTVPGPPEDFSRATSRPALFPTLVQVWNQPQRDRVGELALLDFSLHSTLFLGRFDREVLAGRAAADPRLLHFFRMRPGWLLDCGPLDGDAISRLQLEFRRGATGFIEVQSVGLAKFLINGHVMAEKTWHRLQPGDVLHLAQHCNLLFTMGPASLPAFPAVNVSHPYGGRDAHGIVGESPFVWDLRCQIIAALRAGGHVFLHGETGTGKELVALALHRLSGRKGRFIASNAANLEDLPDYQLFGNAVDCPNVGSPETPGLFGEANGGTLFLDELARLSPALQAKLLRVLQSQGEYTRLGESRPRRADVLIIGATNEPLAVFRGDLLPRFRNRIELPPLAVRMQDLPLIARDLVLFPRDVHQPVAERFVDRSGERPHVRMTAAFVVAMLRSQYDGNVRDLDNLLSRAMGSEGDALEQPVDMRPWRAPPTLPPPPPAPSAALESSNRHEPRNPDDTDQNPAADEDDLLDALSAPREKILDALARHRGNVTRAAAELHISRDQLRRRMKRLRIDR